MQTEWWVTKQNKNKSHLKCTQYKCRRHVSDMPLVRPLGFPWFPPGLTYWLCGLVTVEQPDGSPAGFFWSSLQSQNQIFFSATPVQRKLEWGGGGILGNRRERKRKELHLCVLILGVKNQCVLRLYCTVLRNSRDRQVTRRLLAAEGCYMGGEAVSAVRPGIKTQSAVALSFCILSRHTGLKVEEGPHLRVQGISFLWWVNIDLLRFLPRLFCVVPHLFVHVFVLF